MRVVRASLVATLLTLAASGGHAASDRSFLAVRDIATEHDEDDDEARGENQEHQDRDEDRDEEDEDEGEEVEENEGDEEDGEADEREETEGEQDGEADERGEAEGEEDGVEEADEAGDEEAEGRGEAEGDEQASEDASAESDANATAESDADATYVVNDSAAVEATACETDLHMPSQVASLSEYKDEAQECLTWCGALSNSCFKGCLNTCTGYLKSPPCAAFVLDQNGCKAACDKLNTGFNCLLTVAADNTQSCHSVLLGVTVPTNPPENSCKYK